MNGIQDIVSLFGILGILFLIIMAVIWFILPFAIFGTKSILKQINSNLSAILMELQKKQ